MFDINGLFSFISMCFCLCNVSYLHLVHLHLFWLMTRFCYFWFFSFLNGELRHIYTELDLLNGIFVFFDSIILWTLSKNKRGCVWNGIQDLKQEHTNSNIQNEWKYHKKSILKNSIENFVKYIIEKNHFWISWSQMFRFRFFFMNFCLPLSAMRSCGFPFKIIKKKVRRRFRRCKNWQI